MLQIPVLCFEIFNEIDALYIEKKELSGWPVLKFKSKLYVPTILVSKPNFNHIFKTTLGPEKNTHNYWYN